MKKTLIAAATLALVAACGGGGGSTTTATSTTTTPVVPVSVISTANYQEVSNASAASVADVGSSSSLSKIADASASGDTGAGAQAISTYELAQAALAQVGATSWLERAQVVSAQTVSCGYTGTGTVSVNDANNNNLMDGGDSATISYNNCSFAAGQAPISGSMTLNITSVTRSGNTITGGVFGFTFNNMTSASSTLNGAVNMSFTSNQATLAYSNFTSVRKGKSSTYGYTAVVTTSGSNTSLTINGPITVSAGAFTLQTITPMAYSGVYPTAGLIRATDSAGNRADITPAGTQFSVSFYPAGSTIASATYTAAWSSIL